MKRTFLKIIDENNYLEVGCIEGYVDISMSSLDDDVYLSIKITEDEIQELIDFLTEKRKELERIITERKG